MPFEIALRAFQGVTRTRDSSLVARAAGPLTCTVVPSAYETAQRNLVNNLQLA